VDTLPAVPHRKDDPPQVLTTQDLADRWGISRQRVHQLMATPAPTPFLGAPQRVGRRLGHGTYAWTLAQVEAYERAHEEWCAAGAVEERRSRTSGGS
jgi:hypothetical protein